MEHVLRIAAITLADFGRGRIREKVNLEAPPVVMIDQTPDRLHPIMVRKKRRDISDPNPAAPGLHGTAWAFGRRAHGKAPSGPRAARIQYGLVVARGISRNDHGNCRFRQSGITARRGLPKPIERPFRSEEHTSELQSRPHLVCRLLLA